jgi:hypothetical protein
MAVIHRIISRENRETICNWSTKTNMRCCHINAYFSHSLLPCDFVGSLPLCLVPYKLSLLRSLIFTRWNWDKLTTTNQLFCHWQLAMVWGHGKIATVYEVFATDNIVANISINGFIIIKKIQ